MRCPFCGSDLIVNRTRDLLVIVERNRRCLACGRYLDTVEVFKDEYDNLINNTDNDESGWP